MQRKWRLGCFRIRSKWFCRVLDAIISQNLLKIHEYQNFNSDSSLEISWFFSHSDFAWNQFSGLQRCKNCHFNSFRSSEFLFPWIFVLLKVEIYQSNKFQSPYDGKNGLLELLDSTNLISCKVWVIENHEISTLWTQTTVFPQIIPKYFHDLISKCIFT